MNYALKKKFTLKTLSSLLFNETDPFEDFILKLYRHNLIDWSSIGNISFASNSIQNKYINHLNDIESPSEYNYFLNCVSAAKKFVNMNIIDVEELSFKFLSNLIAYINSFDKDNMNEAILNAELY